MIGYGQLEERLGYLERAKEVYGSGLKHCSSCVPLWLSLAKLEEKMNGLSKARAVLSMARKKNPQSPELWLAAVRAESRHGNRKEADILIAKALQVCPNSGILCAASIEMVPRPQRKTKSMDALKRCDHSPHVIAAIAKLFRHDMKVDKARSWLNRAVTLGSDIGDIWALFYKFEIMRGTEVAQADVLRRCIAAEPKHGEKWEAMSKAVENSHQPTEVILKKVAVARGKEETSAEGGCHSTKYMTGASCGIKYDSVFVYREATLDTNDLTTLSKGCNSMLVHNKGTSSPTCFIVPVKDIIA